LACIFSYIPKRLEASTKIQKQKKEKRKEKRKKKKKMREKERRGNVTILFPHLCFKVAP
jgi:hypothetical protein